MQTCGEIFQETIPLLLQHPPQPQVLFFGCSTTSFLTKSSYITKPHHTCINLLNQSMYFEIFNASLYGILPFTILLPFSVLKMTLRKKNLGSKVNILKCHFDNSNQAVNSQCCQSNLKIIT
jgi:hypothetical protein